MLALLLIAISGAWADVDYYVVGTFNNWTRSDDYKLTHYPNEQCYKLMNLPLAAGAELKVQSSEGTWYPDGGEVKNYKVESTGTYTVFFRLDAQGMGWYEDYLLVEDYVAPPTGSYNVDISALFEYEDSEDEEVSGSTTLPLPTAFDLLGWFQFINRGWIPATNIKVEEISGPDFERGEDQGWFTYLKINAPGTYVIKGHWLSNPNDKGTITIVVTEVDASEPVISEDGKTATITALGEDMVIEYELVRDMEYKVEIATPAAEIRIQRAGGVYSLANEEDLSYAAVDNIDGTASAMTLDTDYEAVLQKKVDGNWTTVSELSQGTFRLAFTGFGLYDGVIYTNEFDLFAGYEVAVRAHEFVTYHHNEALTTTDMGAHLYTVKQVSEEAETATIAPIEEADMYMPFLVYNSTDEDKVFLLVPTGNLDCTQTFAEEFLGTDEPLTLYSSNGTYYALNGKQFVRVRGQLDIPAHRSWLSIGNHYAAAAALRLVFEGEAETGIETLANDNKAAAPVYDLNGRKVVNPSQPGVYIESNRKQLRVK